MRKSIGDPDFVYKPWTDEQRLRRSKQMRAKLKPKREIAKVTKALAGRLQTKDAERQRLQDELDYWNDIEDLARDCEARGRQSSASIIRRAARFKPWR